MSTTFWPNITMFAQASFFPIAKLLQVKWQPTLIESLYFCPISNEENSRPWQSPCSLSWKKRVFHDSCLIQHSLHLSFKCVSWERQTEKQSECEIAKFILLKHTKVYAVLNFLIQVITMHLHLQKKRFIWEVLQFHNRSEIT